MAVVHHTTLIPAKLELLASWLPAQSWYDPRGSDPVLAKAGGFRLDDPAGQVGIEFMVVTDSAAGHQAASYHIPLTYRGAPLAGAEDGLVGEAEHGVLGHRWIYDGVHDQVLLTQLAALLEGSVQAQAQSVSDTPDESVTVYLAGSHASVADIEIIRKLQPGQAGADRGTGGYVETGWLLPDGSAVRGLIARAASQDGGPAGDVPAHDGRGW
jgi:hypothetical protein